MPIGDGYVGTVAQTGEPLNIGFDLYDHPKSSRSKLTDQATGYRTCSLLCMPVRDRNGKLLGVTQLVNKRRQGNFPPYDPNTWPEAPECFQASFDNTSQKHMEVFNTQVGIALQNVRHFNKLEQQSNYPRNVVSKTLELLDQVMDKQRFDEILDKTLRSITLKLGQSLGADRTTIFLLDADRQEFWSIVAETGSEASTLEVRVPVDQGIVGEVAAHRCMINIQFDNGCVEEVRLNVGEGFAGEVAKNREPLNIPFDLYNHPASARAQTIDAVSGYRTCSLLCMPILNQDGELIGVTQLVNKKKAGHYPVLPLVYGEPVPELYRTSFDESDQKCLYIFDNQVGMLIQNAELLAAVRQQEQRLREDLSE